MKGLAPRPSVAEELENEAGERLTALEFRSRLPICALVTLILCWAVTGLAVILRTRWIVQFSQMVCSPCNPPPPESILALV
jgi:hypothetical protein